MTAAYVSIRAPGTLTYPPASEDKQMLSGEYVCNITFLSKLQVRTELNVFAAKQRPKLNGTSKVMDELNSLHGESDSQKAG